MDLYAKQYRECLVETLRPYDKDIPFALSGGVDSAHVLAARLLLGHKPRCFTFYLSSVDKRLSTDAVVSRDMCKTLGLRWTPVVIPRNVATLKKDVYRVLRIGRTARKTHVQCGHAWLYLCDAARVAGYDQLMIGMMGGTLFGSGKHLEMAPRYYGEEWFRRMRQSLWDVCRTDPNHSLVTLDKIAKTFGLTVHDPHADHKPLADCVIGFTSTVINHPVQKGIALRAFPEFWKRGKWYRPPGPFQVVSGIREFHDVLLNDSTVNKRGSKTVLGVYHDMLRELEREKTP